MTEPARPKISFGTIVLNGEPFTSHCLRAIYPFAYEIIVVEGACRSAKNISTPDGHSTDGTFESLQEFKREEDPENKLKIVANDGFWSEKDEQSQAYAELATGDYLWQVDIDEFYKAEDMQAVIDILAADPSITAASFKQLQFWGGFSYLVDGWLARRGGDVFHRLFKWGKGYTYSSHRPPTVLDPDGRDLRDIKWLDDRYFLSKGIYLYHYSMVFPKQVRDKSDYYGNSEWAWMPDALQWYRDVYVELKRPYRIHNSFRLPGWLERYRGSHPREIEALMSELASGKLNVAVRRTDDIERLLASRRYLAGKAALKAIEPLDRMSSGKIHESLVKLRSFYYFHFQKEAIEQKAKKGGGPRN